MNTSVSHVLSRSFALIVAAAVLAGCADQAPVVPAMQPAAAASFASLTERDEAIATMQRVTARYHDLQVALDDDFVLLHECENRPDEGPVGAVYVNVARLLDGVIDPALPDALIYAPSTSGRPSLVGVEFAIPYPMWTEQNPPSFLGATFQPEDEFGVWALHAWVWLNNPEGMFAETNPRVSCGA